MKKILYAIIFVFCFYSELFATTYYVRDDGDNGNTGLSDAQAWQTVGKVNSFSFSTGDDVYFKCDDTFTGTSLVVDWEGSSGDHAIIGAYYGSGTIGVSGSKPIIDGNWTAPATKSALIYLHGTTGDHLQYIDVENLYLTKSNWHGVSIKYADYMTVTGFDMYLIGATGVVFDTDADNCTVSSTTMDFVELQNAYHRGDPLGAYYGGNLCEDESCTYWTAGITSVRNENNTIEENTISNCGGEGIGAGRWSDNVHIKNNIVIDVDSAGIYEDCGDNVLIEGNLVYGTRPVDSTACYKGGSCGDAYSASQELDCGAMRTVIRDNYAFGINSGFSVAGGGIYSDPNTKVYGYNNTLMTNNPSANQIKVWGQMTGYIYFYNNIVATEYTPADVRYDTKFFFDATLWDQIEGNVDEHARGPNDLYDTDPLTVKTSWTTVAEGSLALSDFALQSGSDAIDKATPLTTVASGGGSGVTTVTLTDAGPFFVGDELTIGTDEITLSSVNTSTNVIVFTPASDISNSDNVYWRHFNGSLPDLGATEYGWMLSSLSPTSQQECTSDPRDVTMSCTSPVNANCRYSTDSGDTTYADMTDQFTSGEGTTSHSVSVSQACGGSTKYYVICNDGNDDSTRAEIIVDVEAEGGWTAPPGGIIYKSNGLSITYNSNSITIH